METINIHVTQPDLNTTVIELLLACRMEQIRNRALLETLVDNMFTEEQKQELSSLVNQKLTANVPPTPEAQPELSLQTEELSVHEEKPVHEAQPTREGEPQN